MWFPIKCEVFSLHDKKYETKNRVTSRSSRPELLYKKVALKNFAKFTEKHECQSP